MKIFLCGIFMMCGGEIGKVTPLLTLMSRLRYVGVLLGGRGRKLSSKVVVWAMGFVMSPC